MQYCGPDKDSRAVFCENANMVKHKKTQEKTPENHLKAWREWAEMTQEELAAKVGTNNSVISLIESGNRKLSDKWAHRLAPHIRKGTMVVMPGWLLDHHPDDISRDIFSLWAGIPDEMKPQARRVLETFSRKA